MDNNWKKRADELPHYEPAHVTQNKSLDSVLDNIPGLPPQPDRNPASQNPRSQNNGGWKDVDVGQISNRLIQKKLYQQETPSQQQATVVTLREGHDCFRQLNMPADISLAIHAGPLSGISGREFEFKGIKQFYILKNQHEPVDLSTIDRTKLIKLAVVSAPFVGTLLVSENAVITTSNKRTRELLKG